MTNAIQLSLAGNTDIAFGRHDAGTPDIPPRAAP